MGSAASATVREKFPDDAENLIREFQFAVMKAAGVQENSMCSAGGECCPTTQHALQALFDQADVNHDGKLDQQELVSFVERLNFEMEDSLKTKLKENMKTVLLALTDDSMSVLFDQFMQCLSGCGPNLCESLIVSKDPKRIVFVGATGCGKSSLCTALTGHKKKGSPFKIGNRPSSETSECNAGTFRWFGDPEEEEFIIIDTPGLDDELGRDDEFINKIIDCMREVEYVNSIVLVVNAENLRFSTSLQKMIKHFEKAFSPRFYDHSIICLTKWYMDDDSIDEREEDGKTEESVSHELVKKICESPNLMCKGSLPVLFVDSFYEKRDPKNGKERLRKIKESIGSTVFRTGDLTKLKPRIIELSNVAQVIKRGQTVSPMVPHLFDIIETRGWECRPPLPEGLSCCTKKGRITGMAVSLSPLSEYQLFAESAGGWSEGFPFSLEVKHSETDIKGIILNSLRPLQDKLELWLPLEGPSIPQTEEDLKAMTTAASEKAEALLGEIIEGLRAENELISTFSDIVTTLTQESERRVIQMQDEFAVEHQKKQLDIQRLRLKAEKDLEIQLIRETTNAEAMRNYIRAAEVAGVNEELIGFGRAHLEKITPHPCKHADLGCGVVLRQQFLEDHEAICMFGLPLFGKQSVQIKKASPQSGGVVVKAVSGEGASWSGHYEYKEADDTFLFINRELRRVQGLKKTDSDDPSEEELPWVFFFYTEADGPQTIVFSSTNSSSSVLDATFEEFELTVTESYSWSDVAVPETPQKGSIKILYFGGKWCPYCPPFTAKLAAFYKTIRSQKGEEALDVVFISSDQTEKHMFEYYYEEHGDWFAMPYSERDKKELLSSRYDITGIPGAVLVNNKMEAVNFPDLVSTIKSINDKPGPKQNNDALRIYEKMFAAVRATDGTVGEEDTTVDMFCSLRFAEALPQAKEIQKILREKHNLNAVIVSTPQGEDIAAQVATLLDAARMVLIFGTETYGKGTVNFSTKEELQFIMDEKKPFFLIKMCDRFAESRTRLVLSKAVAYFLWMPSDPMPSNLIPEILAKYEDAVLNPKAL